MRTGYNCSAPSPPNYVSNDTREQRCARPVIAVFFPAITVQNRAREKARETRRAKRAKHAKRAKTTFRARARENPRARTARPARPGLPGRTAGREGPSMQARNASASKTPVSLVAYLRAELGNSFSYWVRIGGATERD